MTHYMTLSYDVKYLHVENSIPKFSEISIENLYIDVIFSKNSTFEVANFSKCYV